MLDCENRLPRQHYVICLPTGLTADKWKYETRSIYPHGIDKDENTAYQQHLQL